MNNFGKNLVVWIVISLVLVALFNVFNKPMNAQMKISYSQFVKLVEQGEVAGVRIEGEKVVGKMINNNSFVTYIPNNDNTLIPLLLKKGVSVDVKPKEESPWYITLLVSWFPMLLLIGVWIFFYEADAGGSRRW